MPLRNYFSHHLLTGKLSFLLLNLIIQNSPIAQDLVDEGVLLLQGNVFALDVTNLVENSFRVAGHGHFRHYGSLLDQLYHSESL